MDSIEKTAATATAIGLAVVIGVWAVNSTITLFQRINKIRKDEAATPAVPT